MMSWRVSTPIGSPSSVTTIAGIRERQELVRAFDLVGLLERRERPAHHFADRLVQDVGVVEDRSASRRRR